MAQSGPPSLRIVDPHMHMWDLDRLYYAWLQDTPLPHNPAGDTSGIAYRSYGLDDYLADASGFWVDKVVHVECGLPPSDQIAETAWLQEMAASRGYPQGIVAGASLDDPGVEAVLEAHARNSNVRGVRQILNWHTDPLKAYTPRDLIQDDRWRAGFALLAKYRLSFDLQIYPSQMASAADLAARHPDTLLILNHGGMPTDRDQAGLETWRKGMALLAGTPNVAVKISGFGGVDRAWSVDSIRPFVLHAIELFGVNRTMFASNFPVERVHGAFGRHFDAFDAITRDFSDDERRRLFAETAEHIYRI
jgi:predicted TIM-barrel fold metal-dependent hydrolase